jgi:hypothetical protein
LDNVLPDIAVFSLAVPFELLKTRRELKNRWEPIPNPFFVSAVKFSVLLDEMHLPIWEPVLLSPCIRWYTSETLSWCNIFE